MAGTIVSDTIQDGAGNTAPTTTAIKGCAKAFVNFTGGATPSINQAFNVSSVTNASTGDYTVNFTTVIGNTTYTTAMSAEVATPNGSLVCGTGAVSTKASGSYRFQTTFSNGSQTNPTNAALVVFTS